MKRKSISNHHNSFKKSIDKYASRMKTAIQHLTKFCRYTGLDDVVWRNIPLYNKSILTNCEVKIVLVDLGEM
jgi:hypothetical protein